MADQFITSPTQSTLQLHPWQTSSLHHQHKALYNSTLGRPVHYITKTKHFTTPPLADQFITSPTQSTLQLHPWQTSSLHHQHKALYNSTLGRPVHYITNTKHFTTPPLADQFITSPRQSTLQLHPWQTSSLHHQDKALYSSTLGRPVHYITNTKHFTAPPLADQFITSPTQSTLQLHHWQTSSLHHQHKALYNSTLGRPVHYITNTKHFTTPPLADQFITSPTQSTLQLHHWQTSSLHHQHKALYNSTLGRPVHYITKTKHFTTPPLADQFITSPRQSTLQLHPWQTSSLHHQHKALYNSTLGRPVHYITKTKHVLKTLVPITQITHNRLTVIQLYIQCGVFLRMCAWCVCGCVHGVCVCVCVCVCVWLVHAWSVCVCAWCVCACACAWCVCVHSGCVHGVCVHGVCACVHVCVCVCMCARAWWVCVCVCAWCVCVCVCMMCVCMHVCACMVCVCVRAWCVCLVCVRACCVHVRVHVFVHGGWVCVCMVGVCIGVCACAWVCVCMVCACMVCVCMVCVCVHACVLAECFPENSSWCCREHVCRGWSAHWAVHRLDGCLPGGEVHIEQSTDWMDVCRGVKCTLSSPQTGWMSRCVRTYLYMFTFK